MLVCSQETKDLFAAVDPGKCMRLVGDVSLHHFAYPIKGIVESVKRETSVLASRRQNAEGASRLDELAYSNDEFDLDRSITQDAMAQVYTRLIEYAKGIGESYLYDNNGYKVHRIAYDRGYVFFTEYTVSEMDSSVTIKLFSNKPIAEGQFVRMTADIEYDKIDIWGNKYHRKMAVEHKFIASDEYAEFVKTTKVDPPKDECLSHKPVPPVKMCIHHAGLPCKNLGMLGTHYCQHSCRVYAPGEQMPTPPKVPVSDYAETIDTTYYVYTIRMTPNYDADFEDRGLGSESVENVCVHNCVGRAYDNVPVIVSKGDWLEIEMPNGDVEMYLCHTSCTTNNKLGCPNYYRYMTADLRHTIHYVLYFPELRNMGSLRALDQHIHDALVEYCIYRWFFIIDPTEAERYYTAFNTRLDLITDLLSSASGGCLQYTTPRYF